VTQFELENYMTVRGHMMPPPLHLSDIIANVFVPPLPWQSKKVQWSD